MRLDTPVGSLPSIGPARATALAAAGIETVEDLLHHVPRRYEDRTAFGRAADLAAGAPPVTLAVRVVSSRLIRTRRRGFSLVEATVADDSGSARVLWYNQPGLARSLTPGRHVVLWGRAVLTRLRRGVVLEHPEVEVLDGPGDASIHTGRIVPVYRAIGDLRCRRLRTLVHHVLDSLEAEGALDPLPPRTRARLGLPERLAVLRAVHEPPAGAEADARRALALEELFVLQLALACGRDRARGKARPRPYPSADPLRTVLAGALPFALTGAQRRVLAEIARDLASARPMGRLLQGDVGSGKTIVALLSLLVAVEAGRQAALMAPTEVLAEQHARRIGDALARAGIATPVHLITGAQPAAVRRSVLAGLASGEIGLVVGTHALIEPGVRFRDLALVVVDEQHRFGVGQRTALAAKGDAPDLLVMTATPIPRSLALTLYGDLDLSVLDELPPGRLPVRTLVRRVADRPRVEQALRAQLARGRQAYVVVPAVEEGPLGDVAAATSRARRLRDHELSGFTIGLLHGRLPSAEKERVAQAFARGEIQALVATTVVEVGLDVPNATVMIVEHAERFGLSQLHQLRGRVGRGTEESTCVLLVADEQPGEDARERLRVLEETSDGFAIAERDLELRGPGAVLGAAQHGAADLPLAWSALREPALVEAARAEVAGLDPGARRQALARVRPGLRRRLGLLDSGRAD